jgi:hypothetical protein
MLAVLAAGCQASAPAVRKPSTDIDPCAERLHDACGRLLLYCSIHGGLPETLDQLNRVDLGALPTLVCPVSEKPYVYRREGLSVPGRAGLLVLYDAEPVHTGMRWGILVEPGAAGGPLTGRVLLLPESAVFPASK